MSSAKTPNDLLLQIVKEKHDQLPVIMKEHNINCWLLFARETSMNPDPVFNLVIGGDIVWDSVFLFFYHKNQDSLKKIAIVGNFDEPAEKRKRIWDEVIAYKEGISKHLIRIIDEINPAKIALNYSEDDVVSDGLSHGMYLKLSKILAKKKDYFISAAPIIRSLQGRKTKTELELITKACQITEEINNSISSIIEVGMSEIDVQQLYYKEMDKRGVSEAWQRISCPAIDAGPDKEVGHVGPLKESYLKKGHTLHNDFGIKYKGYCSDLQRMWFFGTKNEIPNELKHAFKTVKEAIIKASKFIKPGVLGYEVDSIARDHVLSRGYSEYDHALGHQVGREAHDGGIILGPNWERYGDTTKGKIEEGNVFTLELHVKTKNYGIVSLEENIVVTKEGCEFLVQPQEEFILV